MATANMPQRTVQYGRHRRGVAASVGRSLFHHQQAVVCRDSVAGGAVSRAGEMSMACRGASSRVYRRPRSRKRPFATAR